MYHNRPMNPHLYFPRGMLLLLSRLAFLDPRRLACRRQADGYIYNLQNCQRCKDVEQRGDGVGNDGVELVCIEREDDGRMGIGVYPCDVVFEGLDGCGGAGFRLGGSGCVDDGFAGHGCGCAEMSEKR